jgi:putative hemolysin
MDLLLIVFLTLLNGVFAMSEMAVASSRKARLQALHDAGEHGAAAALSLMQEPTRFLSTVQVGITSIGMLNGIVGEAAFSGALALKLQIWGVSAAVAGGLATAIVVTLITFTTIIFGELVPKRIGQLYPETVARFTAVPMAWLARVAGPFVKLLSLATQTVLVLMRVDTKAQRRVTEEEITASLEEGVDAGLIEAHEHQMVRNVFHLDDRPLTSMMTARADIVWLDADLDVATALQKIQTETVEYGAHSWYPVCKDGLSHVVGVVSVTRLLAVPADDALTLQAYMEPAHFVPETLTGMELLEQLKDHSGRMLFVVDEYGDIQGLLTPRDLLEAITGELKPAQQLEGWATQRPDGSWLLDGQMPLSELKSRLQIKALPDEDRGRYNTVAGLIMYLLGDLPITGQITYWQEWSFEVVDMDARRIDKVLASCTIQSDENNAIN